MKNSVVKRQLKLRALTLISKIQEFQDIGNENQIQTPNLEGVKQALMEFYTMQDD